VDYFKILLGEYCHWWCFSL